MRIMHPNCLHFVMEVWMFLKFFWKSRGSLFREHIPIFTSRGFMLDIFLDIGSIIIGLFIGGL